MSPAESPARLFIGPGWFKRPDNLWHIWLYPCTNSYASSCRTGKVRASCQMKRTKKIIKRYLAATEGCDE